MLELHCSNLTLLKNKSSILHFILNYFTMFSIVATEKKMFHLQTKVRTLYKKHCGSARLGSQVLNIKAKITQNKDCYSNQTFL